MIERDHETNFYRLIRRDDCEGIYDAARSDEAGGFYRAIGCDDVCEIDKVINIGDVRDRAERCIPRLAGPKAATQLCVVEWNGLPRYQAKR